MNIRQILKFAQDNGFDSVMFEVKNKEGKRICVGKFLDAYFEFITIPILGEGFVRIGDLEDILGYDIQFEVLQKKEYYIGAFLDLTLRGKEVPKEIQDGVNSLSEE